MQKDVIIIGGGAAGLYCAIEAGKRGRSVLILEHAERIGKKIAISGGGRCNFTNVNTSPDNFISTNPDFCISALARHRPEDFIRLVKAHGIGYHEKKLGQLFCNRSSREIIDLLLRDLSAVGAEVRLKAHVRQVSKADRFRVETDDELFESAALVVATGGLSIPKMGATDFGYRVARQFDLKVVAPRPALVPLTYSPRDAKAFGDLSGISMYATVQCQERAFDENVLLTHRGLSGPAILQISSYWTPGERLQIDLFPHTRVAALLSRRQRTNQELVTLLSEHLPRRFAQRWCQLYAISKPMNQYTPAELGHIAELLHGWQIHPSGTEGFTKAEVTAGGVDTRELSSKTMEARKVPGLYFIGEVVDVTGHLGGFNFQWAWSSAHAAGQYV